MMGPIVAAVTRAINAEVKYGSAGYMPIDGYWAVFLQSNTDMIAALRSQYADEAVGHRFHELNTLFGARVSA